MSEIAIAPSMNEYFRGVVTEAVLAKHVEATEAAVSYLVALLCEFAHPDEEAGSAFGRPLTFLLRDALDAAGPERFKRLRTLGDGVLYAVGFFGPHMRLSDADRGYVVTVGSMAYDHAAAMLRLNAKSRGPDVLGELAAKFDRFVVVLNDVADGTLARSANDERSVVKLYERWLKTGSDRLAAELASRGLVPTRAKGGLN